MAHLQNWFGLLYPDIATILPWSDKPLFLVLCLSSDAVMIHGVSDTVGDSVSCDIFSEKNMF